MRDIMHKRQKHQEVRVSLLNAFPRQLWNLLAMANAQEPHNVQVLLPADAPNEQDNQGQQQRAAPELAPLVEENQQPDQAPPVQINDQLKALKAEIEVLKMNRQDPQGEQPALQLVRQLASAPLKLCDPTMILSALQNLSDVARCSNHPRAAEYEAILRQTRPLAYRPEFGDVIIRLVGTKEETTVASTIAKMVKNTPRQPRFQPYRRPLGNRGIAWRPGRARGVCFACGRPGHFQRNCPVSNEAGPR